ncbi:hypothetical protein LEN26_009404 [Aphanomyces euteiches]|nr:hypothetical protein LEN26_009404 [Aphanomyces euteiches]
MMRSILKARWAVAPMAGAAATFLSTKHGGSHCDSPARSIERPKPRAIMANPDEFAARLAQMVRDGPSQLLLIADFDYTLSPYYKPSGEQAHSCHGIVDASGHLGPDFRAKANALFQQFYPIEISPLLTHDEKEPHMIQWWERSHKLMIDYGFKKHYIDDGVAAADIALRDGFQPLFVSLAQAQVPTLIFSAGLADVIRAVLTKHWGAGFWTPNVHVISNVMHFNESVNLVGFQDKLIHCHNKNAEVIRDTPFWDECHSRRNVLLLGDSVGDIQMTHGLDEKLVLRVGFLNTHVEERLEEYLRLYDVVIVHDGTLHLAHLLVDLITNQKNEPSVVS